MVFFIRMALVGFIGVLVSTGIFAQQSYDYSLVNINPTVYQSQTISPSLFLGKPSLHYFGHQNCPVCTQRLGQLNALQDLYGSDVLQIVAIGQSAYSSSNSGWISAGPSVPIVVDTQSSGYSVWSSWDANWRDLYFLDAQGHYVDHFNITSWNEALITDLIESLIPYGDLNSDGALNVLDVVALVNVILSGGYTRLGDLNNDGSVDVLDIVQLVGQILG